MLRFENVRTRYQAGTLGCEGAAELLGVASATATDAVRQCNPCSVNSREVFHFGWTFTLPL